MLMSLSGMVLGNHRVDLDLLFHVPIDDLRHVGAAPRAAEGGAAPGTAGDELERAGPDLRARGRDPDDDALAPALVAAFQRRTHQIDIADALEGVIRAPLVRSTRYFTRSFPASRGLTK